MEEVTYLKKLSKQLEKLQLLSDDKKMVDIKKITLPPKAKPAIPTYQDKLNNSEEIEIEVNGRKTKALVSESGFEYRCKHVLKDGSVCNKKCYKIFCGKHINLKQHYNEVIALGYESRYEKRKETNKKNYAKYKNKLLEKNKKDNIEEKDSSSFNSLKEKLKETENDNEKDE